jgi:hypothetical protein
MSVNSRKRYVGNRTDFEAKAWKNRDWGIAARALLGRNMFALTLYG